MKFKRGGVYLVVAHKSGDITFTCENGGGFVFDIQRLFQHMNECSLINPYGDFENTCVLAKGKRLVFSYLSEKCNFSSEDIEGCEKQFDEGYEDYAFVHIGDYDCLTTDLFNSLVVAGKVKVLCSSKHVGIALTG